MVYNQNDIDVRTAVAAHGIACKASAIAKRARLGSSDALEEKKLQMCVAQLDWIRHYKILAASSHSTINITADGGTDVSSHLVVDSVQISETFLFTTDAATTAQVIADAINNYTSTPEYTAVVRGTAVDIITTTKDSSKNGLAVTQVGGDVTFTAEYFNGGQDGVEASDNYLTEDQLSCLFDNIAEFTGCCYAPIGYNYKTESNIAPQGVIMTLNSGTSLLYNTTVPIQLNTLQLINSTI